MLMKTTEHIGKTQPQADEHEIVAPTSKLPIYRATDGERTHVHKIVGPVYERSHLKAQYDINLFDDVINKSKRFNRIKPEALTKILSERRKYTYIQKYAIERLKETWHRQLHIISNLNQCEKDDYKPNDELAHTIFNWGWNDFLTRRRLKNFVWVDVMQRTTESCLHIYKFHKDLEQLQGYVDQIFHCLFCNLNDEEFDIYQTVEKPIDEAKKVLHTTNFLEDEFNKNSYLYWQLLQTHKFNMSVKRQTEENFMKILLQNRLLSSHIWDPIEVRYTLNWFYNIVHQNQYRMDYLQETYQRDSQHYKKMKVRENCIDSSCMDFFYTNIEIYKNRINDLQAKFDADLEVIDHRLDLKRNRIYKLNELRRSLTDDIARFHKEEEIMEERERLKFEESERRRKQAELLATDTPTKQDAKEKKTSKSRTKAPKYKK